MADDSDFTAPCAEMRDGARCLVRSWFLDGVEVHHEHRFHADRVTVAPDREALARVLWEHDRLGVLPEWSEISDDLRGQYREHADPHIASGVLGVNPDTIRAEALEAAAKAMPSQIDLPNGGINLDYGGGFAGWLRARAAEYRQAAGGKKAGFAETKPKPSRWTPRPPAPKLGT